MAVAPDSVSLILAFLPGRDVARFSRVSKLWYELASDNALWQHLYRRDYGDTTAEVSDWKKRYQLNKDPFLMLCANDDWTEELFHSFKVGTVCVERFVIDSSSDWFEVEPRLMSLSPKYAGYLLCSSKPLSCRRELGTWLLSQVKLGCGVMICHTRNGVVAGELLEQGYAGLEPVVSARSHGRVNANHTSENTEKLPWRIHKFKDVFQNHPGGYRNLLAAKSRHEMIRCEKSTGAQDPTVYEYKVLLDYKSDWWKETVPCVTSLQRTKTDGIVVDIAGTPSMFNVQFLGSLLLHMGSNAGNRKALAAAQQPQDDGSNRRSKRSRAVAAPAPTAKKGRAGK